jgi:malonate transporter
MAIVIAALLPVFLLIVLGAVLKRTLMRLDTQWHGLERLTYYVLFPKPISAPSRSPESAAR